MTPLSKENLELLIEEILDKENEYIVELSVSPASIIRVEVDSMEGITIDRCAAISRAIEARLDRDACDFSLEVSSAGLSSPLRHIRQYQKLIGKPITALRKDGIRLDGVLITANEHGFTIQTETIKPAWKDEAGKKHKKEIVCEEHHFAYDDMKEVCYRFV